MEMETQEELDNMLIYIEMTKEQIEEHNDIEYQKYITLLNGDKCRL